MESQHERITNAVLLARLEERWKASDERLARMEDNIIGVQKQSLAEQQKTNGRVTKVEDEVEVIQRWQLEKDTKLNVSYWWIGLAATLLIVVIGFVVEYISNQH
jgi:hypothetical protein